MESPNHTSFKGNDNKSREDEVNDILLLDRSWTEEEDENFFNFKEDRSLAHLEQYERFLRYGLCLSDTDKVVVNANVTKGKTKYKEMRNETIINEMREKDPKKYVECVIKIESGNQALCFPLEGRGDVIKIKGRGSAGQTFTDDVVIVEIIKEEERLGQVVHLVSRTRFNDVKNPVFLCCAPKHSNLMKPLCKTVPKIFILQDPNYEMNEKAIEIYKYDLSTNTLQLESKKTFSEEERKEKYFLVTMLNWNCTRTYPVGAIIGVVECSDNPHEIKKHLELIYNIPSFYSEETLQETKKLEESPIVCMNADDEYAFTIDGDSAECLDDAISVVDKENGTFILRVHITDVASQIPKDSAIDKDAKAMGETQYLGRMRMESPRNMLPKSLCLNRLSLLPDKKRRQTISMVFMIKQQGDTLKIDDFSVKIMSIVSKRKFSYKEVDEILSGNKEDPDFKKLKICHDVALDLKLRRLHIPIDSCSKLLHLRSHDIIEELMIYTNHCMAVFLLKTFPDCVPLRCQDPPSDKRVNQWIEEHQYFADIVIALQNQVTSTNGLEPYISANGIKTIGVFHSEDSKIPFSAMVKIREKVWQKLQSADSLEYHSLINDDKLYSVQSRALFGWKHIQNPAVLRVSDKNHPFPIHFSHMVHPYVRFTSPLRRFIDIVNQRLVHAILNKELPPYIKPEISKICEDMNTKKERLQNFREHLDSVPTKIRLCKIPRLYDAYINSFNNTSILVIVADFCKMSKTKQELKLEIPFSLLQLADSPSIRRQNQNCLLIWERTIIAAPNSGVLEIAQKRSCRYIPVRNWRKLVKAHLSSDFEDIQNFIIKWKAIFEECVAGKDILLQQTISYNNEVKQFYFDKGESDNDNDDNDEDEDNRNTTQLSTKLVVGQDVQIQLAQSVQGQIKPIVQYLAINHNICFCFKHRMDPIECLTKYSTTNTRVYYDSLQEYLSIWLPIMEMESVFNAVKEEYPITIHGMTYTLNNVDGEFTLPAEYCMVCGINLTSSNLDVLDSFQTENSYTNFYNNSTKRSKKDHTVSSANYLCLRCDVAQKDDPSNTTLKWIGHAKITKVKENAVVIDEQRRVENYIVMFQLLDNEQPPREDFEGKIKGTIEYIQKSLVHRQQETIFRRHLQNASDIAQSIALGWDIPDLDERMFFMACVMDKDVPIESLAQNNTVQRKAIVMALTHSFSLIQGPPGTGKTLTGIKLLYLLTQLNQTVFPTKRQIIFCGPSNKSVDHVAKWFVQKVAPQLEQNEIKVIRMYGKAFVYRDFPVPEKFDFITKRKLIKKTDQDLIDKNVVLHHVIRQSHKPHSQKLREFTTRFIENPEEISLEDFTEYENLHSVAEQKELGNYDVIFCTTSMTGNPKLIKATQGKIQQCIIDESGMCTEPETMVPIVTTRPKQVILIGDHKQLQPIVKSRDAARLGLKTSLFERYQEKYLEAPRMMLTQQYRMHPLICKFPSDIFYDSKLKTDERNAASWAVTSPLSLWKNSHSVENHVPLAFFHTEGKEKSMIVSTKRGNENSKSNEKEANVVVKATRYLLRQGVSHNDINVMSQYNAQCSLLKEVLAKEIKNGLPVNTVISSQGGEWDYVIFSTTRSLPQYLIEESPTLDWCFANLGFIIDEHQINVALTRARKGLIIVGNKNLLQTDGVWKKLIQFYTDHDCVHFSDAVLNSD